MTQIGDTVRIERDEYPELVGLVGRVVKMSPDGTTAWVVAEHPGEQRDDLGVWCSTTTDLRVIRSHRTEDT